jgi:hypothetical protein
MTEERLKLFARKVLDMTFDGSIDGDDIQRAALEFGLIRDDVATETDCDSGFEAEPGDHIYRWTSVLTLTAENEAKIANAGSLKWGIGESQ